MEGVQVCLVVLLCLWTGQGSKVNLWASWHYRADEHAIHTLSLFYTSLLLPPGVLHGPGLW